MPQMSPHMMNLIIYYIYPMLNYHFNINLFLYKLKNSMNNNQELLTNNMNWNW